MSLFGPEDDNEDEVANATPTPTVAVPAVDYHTLDRNKPRENDDIGDKQVFMPFTMRVYCLFFLYSYDVTSSYDHRCTRVGQSEGSGWIV